MTFTENSNQYPELDRLLQVMSKLRDPKTGCPWDKQQTFETIVPYTLEEAYEVADAIEQGDMQEVKEELGDLLFQVVFYAQLGNEQDEFDFEAIAKVIADKMVERHPHVFAEQTFHTEDELTANWEASKLAEKTAKGGPIDNSILANIPTGMAPLMRANKLQKKCAKVGFDWTELQPVVDKIHEEIDEVIQEVESEHVNQLAVEEELGDLLFAVVNLSRHLKVDPETALRKANRKFEQRFRAVEATFNENQEPLHEASLEKMEAVWQQVKGNKTG